MGTEGLVSPGYWVVGTVCITAPERGCRFCRPTQRVIATPVAGNTGIIDVSTEPPPPPEPEEE